MSDPQSLVTPAGRRLAFHRHDGRGPTVIFLPGYMSDMEGSKALALEAWCESQGRAFLRFDYGGCGISPGAFEDQGLADWRDDAIAMIDSVDGPVVLVGSSMGGWIMLLAALARPDRIAGLVGIAAAPDFTEWGFSDADKATIARNGRLVEDTPYGDQPYVTTRIFWDSGESLKLLGAEIAIGAPVRLLHGQADPDVPFDISLRIAQRLRSADVQTILVKDGDHRLSRPQDIVLLTATLSQLLEAS